MAAMEAQQAMENEDGLEGTNTSISEDFACLEIINLINVLAINILCHFFSYRYC